MSVWRPFSVRNGRHLPGADAPGIWALVADPSRFHEWTPADQVDWARDLPEAGDVFSGRLPIGPLRRRVDYEIAEWEAGHRYRLRVSGVPLVRKATVEVTLELDRPDLPRVVLAQGGETLPPLVPVLEAWGSRWAERALERLEGTRRWPPG